MTITVTNRKHGGTDARTVYCGRPSPLGNPFPVTKDQPRATAIARYAAWLDEELQGDTAAAHAYDALLGYAEEAGRRGDVLALECWCAPLPCHCDVLKARLDDDRARRMRGA